MDYINREMIKVIVKKRKIDIEEKLVGIHNNNPLIDTRRYEVEFFDGSILYQHNY